MKITWLGQAGLLLVSGSTKIMIDPYFSDSVKKVNPKNYRRTPVNPAFFSMDPDILLFTHDHLDHYDPETAPILLENSRKAMTVLCPGSVWQKARACGGDHNYVLFDRHTQWTEGNFRFRAVKAVHSDSHAIGVVIEDLSDNRVYYIAGDTLYSDEIFSDLPERIDFVFVPVNGVGNNMNATDAERFCRRCGANFAVPYHVGMFDALSPEILAAGNRLILNYGQEKEV